VLARLRFAWAAAGGSFAVVLGYILASPARGPALPEVVHYAIPLMLPAAVFSGCLFTLLGAELCTRSGERQPAIGRLTSANTLGSALGAALAGFVLLPRVGIESSLFLVASGYALLPLILVQGRSEWKKALPAAFAGAALLLFPFGRMEAHLAQAARLYQTLDGSTVVKVTQGPTTTLQVLRRERFGEAAAWRLLTDSYSMSGIDRASLRYMQLFAWLPLALHPDPRRALLISYGAGNTAQALLDEPALSQLTVVDVSPEILAASPVIHGMLDPLKDPRVRLVLEDGRHYLLTQREQFDLITGEPPPPMMAGVVNLYTREYFALLARRLAPGGLATYWLPVHQLEPSGARAVVAAFCDAFSDCTLWAGSKYHWILLGGRGFEHRPDAKHFVRLWRDPASAWRIAASGLEHPAQLGATFLADAAQLRGWYGGTSALSDDHPKRLAAQPTAPEVPREYSQWLEPETARRHFETSPWIAAHWPAELLRVTPPYFAAQPVLNGELPPASVQRLQLVDLFLRNTDLRIPIFWLLGSDIPEQQILSRRIASDGSSDRPEYFYPLGVRALAERDYARAAGLFSRAAGQDPRQAGALAAYAMCRAGRRDRAAAVPGADLLAQDLRCWRAKR
ncbi:MAG TPA: hypothetical protein VE258_05710, partial [Ktedonobacterales bacterium]|nr:hypothetical protein [Ktedonobacterales bacterium]